MKDTHAVIVLLLCGTILFLFVATSGSSLTSDAEETIIRSSTDQINPMFDSKSFWYTPIPDNVALHPNSSNLVAAFQRQKATGKDNIVGINTESFASPIYVANENTPATAARVDHCPEMGESNFEALATRLRAVPIPDFAEPACGTDSEMTIYQPSTDTMWEFWRAKKNDNGEWQTCWGGRMDQVSKSSGILAQAVRCDGHRPAICRGTNHCRRTTGR